METTATEPHFAFGKNWTGFLKNLNEARILGAEESLKRFLDVETLEGKTFLDLGSGSGLSSLAARRLGAKVSSYDYDEGCVSCTEELRRRYYADDPSWVIGQGDALDAAWLASLGQFDVVCSWGVLHHTGDLWTALDNAGKLVKEDGLLFVSIGNDQGRASRFWTRVKRTYNHMPAAARPALIAPMVAYFLGPPTVRDLLIGKPFDTIRNYPKRRGMSPYHDIIDWIGGYPFQVAKPEEVFDFYRKKGFELERMKTCAGAMGCNEFLFRAKR